MILRDLSFLEPAENILFDDVLLKMAEKGQAQETLRFWESKRIFIVLGRTSNLFDDVNIENAGQDHIPVLRRSSGGGTVVQGPGCLNYTLVLSKDSHPDISFIRKSYQYILGKVIEALAFVGMKASFRPISDIVINGQEKKISGNAQKRGRKFILHHGTILYGFNALKIERYLKIPKQMPDYRRGRPHSDFVTNVAVSCGRFKKAMASVFNILETNNTLSRQERESLDSFLHSTNIMVDLRG